METAASARRALRAAIAKDDGDWSDAMAVAYMRLLLAFRSKSGVRLTADEVYGLMTMDSAVSMAAENIEADLIRDDE